MYARYFITFWHHLRYVPLLSALTFSRRRGFDARARAQDTLTSLAPARLALKYGLPMVPAYGTRVDGGSSFTVAFEAAIPPGDPVVMTQAFNDSLSARILDKPDQWYWMLRRWDSVQAP